jgi:hypothetical protein
VHVLDDVQFVAGLVGQLLVDQCLRDDADDAALLRGFATTPIRPLRPPP